MKIILMQQIILKGKPRTFREIRKEFDSNVIPHNGDFISDSVWKDPYEYEVVEVIINYASESCFVRLPIIEIESNDEDRIVKYIEMAKSHNWKCNTL